MVLGTLAGGPQGRFYFHNNTDMFAFGTYILLHSFSRCCMAYVDIIALMAYGVSTYVLLVCVFLDFPMVNSLGASTIFKGIKTY